MNILSSVKSLFTTVEYQQELTQTGIQALPIRINETWSNDYQMAALAKRAETLTRFIQDPHALASKHEHIAEREKTHLMLLAYGIEHNIDDPDGLELIFERLMGRP